MSLTVLRKPIKYIRIAVEPSGDVVVSAPKRVSDKYISEYLESKKAWIVKAQEHYKNAKSLMAVGDGELLLHGAAYRIEGRSEKRKKDSSASPLNDGALVVSQNGGDIAVPQNDRTRLLNDDIDHENKVIYIKEELANPTKQLARYKAYGKEYLTAMLQSLAQAHGLTYAKVIIRNQKTKWGTCSRQKNIGLNWKLVKMPHEIAEYVICHELAHLKQLNHSKKFWAEVELLYPDYKAANAWMRKYGFGLQ